MIIRNFKWVLVISLHLLPALPAQNARSYDTNDWIPIAPTNQPDDTKKAQERVLTLDTPNQNFFPNNDYRKRPQPQQYQETPSNVRQAKTDQPYKFEPVLPLQTPQYGQQNQFIQPQYVQPIQQQLPFIQQPTQQQVLSQQLLAPPPTNQNFYDKGQRYQIPINSSFYQSLNPGAINQELVGAIQNQQINQLTTTAKPSQEKENVQLLYVPLENLNLKSNQQQAQNVFTKPTESARVEKKFPKLPQQNHRQLQLDDIQDDFIKQAFAAHKLQQQLTLGQPLLIQTTTTPKPKKRKPHQPPLAVYMEKSGPANVKDVLEVLKHAKTISVQEKVGPGSPQVFVGPSNIKQPEGYAKFPLPYLSSVQGNRIERKVDELPFFVAPLSYKTPEGYSKIPLPSPHVGSVVVSTKDLHEKNPEPARQAQASQNQIVQDFDVKQPFPQYRPEVSPDYLIGQNAPQQNPSLLGLGDEFLAGLRGGAPQTYEQTPSNNFVPNYQQTPNLAQNYQQTPTREFVPDYQTELKNNPQYYQTTPNYQNDGNVQNYQIPDYQSNVRQETPDNSKEIVRDYDIPNYQSNQKQATPQNSKETVRDYDIPSYQSNVKEAPPTQNSREIVRDYDIPSVPVESKTTFTPTYQPQINQFQSYTTPKPTNIYTYSEEPIKQTTTEAVSVPQNQYKLVQNAQPQLVPQYSRNNQDPLRQNINQYDIEQINDQFGQGKESGRSTTPVVVSTRSYDYDIPTTARSRSKTRHRGRPYSTTSTTPNSVSDEKYTVLEEFSIQPKTTTARYTTEVETIPANVYKLEKDKLEPLFIQNQAPAKTQEEQQPIQNPESVQDPNLPYYNTAQEQEINPYLAGLINNLQDHAVRPLLVPNLLVPTTEKLVTIQPSTEEIREVVTTTEAPRIETTTHRGRTRGRTRANSSRSSSTSSPRRTNRRRPTHTRPTTERQVLRTTTEEAPAYEPTKRTSNQRQRFRTRGRPLSRDFPTTERVTTTEAAFKQPRLEGGFQASSGELSPPQSYYQFDHMVENQQVITIKPEEAGEEKPFKEFHQVYSVLAQTTEQVPETSTTAKPMVDVQITHSVPEEIREPLLAKSPEAQFVGRINSNIQSGGVIHNNRRDESTTRSSARLRGRSRSRGRFASTTPRYTATTTKTTTTTTSKPEEDEEEFYGFIREPAFQKPATLVQTTTQQPVQLYSSSYQEQPRTLIQLEDEEDASGGQDYDTASPTPVQFVGEIRPKYTTTTEPQQTATEAPRFRTRGRIRVPSRKATPQPSYNEVKPQKLDDQVTRRSSNVIRSRSRGKSHFKMPESLSPKPDDHDVEGGNYPSGYLKDKELTTEKPSGFQITIDPYEKEAEGSDQEPNYSLYSPTVVKNVDTEWVEASILPSPNDLQIEDKQMLVDSSEELTTAEVTTAKIEEPTKRRKVSRRRGVWKLVKQRPVDQFETAESQNYHSVLNSFNVVKQKPTVATPTTTEGGILEAIYNIFGMASKGSAYQQPPVVNKTTALPREEDITTTTAPPTFPEEFTEGVTTQDEENTVVPETTTISIKNYDVEPWDMKEVKTSTSTEVSHETEICFKGKCVKSKEDEKSL